jgi:hypothetical protein
VKKGGKAENGREVWTQGRKRKWGLENEELREGWQGRDDMHKVEMGVERQRRAEAWMKRDKQL